MEDLRDKLHECDECGAQAMPEAPKGPILQRLEHEHRQLEQQLAQNKRASEILRANPEFEQFIELQGIIDVPQAKQLFRVPIGVNRY